MCQQEGEAISLGLFANIYPGDLKKKKNNEMFQTGVGFKVCHFLPWFSVFFFISLHPSSFRFVFPVEFFLVCLILRDPL